MALTVPGKRRERFRAGYSLSPSLGDFFISHQWLRELKRRSSGTIAGIYFRIPDEDAVWVGHYNQVYRRMSAAEAIAEFMVAGNREGWQVSCYSFILKCGSRGVRRTHLKHKKGADH